jgi:hypothetical protein
MHDIEGSRVRGHFRYYRNIFLMMGQMHANGILNRISEIGMEG